MALTLKTMSSGGSLVVTIPSQIVEAYDIKSGDSVEIIPVNSDIIMIRKLLSLETINNQEEELI